MTFRKNSLISKFGYTIKKYSSFLYITVELNEVFKTVCYKLVKIFFKASIHSRFEYYMMACVDINVKNERSEYLVEMKPVVIKNMYM